MAIRSDDLIELQRLNLRAYELEAEARRLEAENRVATAQARAHSLHAARAGVATDCVEFAPDELPMTPGGELHEPAFLALLDAAVWARREQQLAELAGRPSNRNGGSAR